MDAPSRLSMAAASAVATGPMCVDYVTVTQVTWEPSANVRRERVGTCTRICVVRLKGNACAVAGENALATTVSATRANLGGSMAHSASVMTSHVQDIRAFSAQVSRAT